jgi:hypothetical protein
MLKIGGGVMLSALSDALSYAPIWQIGLVLFACLTLGGVAGRYLRQRSDRRHLPEKSESDESSLLISSVLGLMALLIAFTFAISVDRFDTRRANVLNEANSIGTTYLRAQLLDPPHRERLSRLLTEYTDVRVELATTLPGQRQNALLATSDRLIVDLWAATVAANPSIRSKDNAYPFLETMNQLIDMDATRKAGPRPGPRFRRAVSVPGHSGGHGRVWYDRVPRTPHLGDFSGASDLGGLPDHRSRQADFRPGPGIPSTHAPAPGLHSPAAASDVRYVRHCHSSRRLGVLHREPAGLPSRIPSGL